MPPSSVVENQGERKEPVIGRLQEREKQTPGHEEVVLPLFSKQTLLEGAKMIENGGRSEGLHILKRNEKKEKKWRRG